MAPFEALLAVAACLARIFGGCVLFALWGGLTAWTWSAIASHFWRVAAMGLMVLILPAALATMMLAITAVEKRIRPRH
jgi:Na+(H+)/acetate symporter ActP